MEILVYLFISSIILYFIVSAAVKKAMEDVLCDFRKDLIEDLERLKSKDNISSETTENDV